MIAAKGEEGRASYTDGKFGTALSLDGSAAMRTMLDLHYDACPQVTVSAWIQVSRDAPADSMHVLSTGGGSGPGITISGTFLTLSGTENGIGQPNAIRKGTWVFVAGVYDYTEGTYTLYWGGRSATQKLSEYRYEPQSALWLGTVHDDWGVFARGVAVDDLRITGRALSTENVTALRTAPASSTSGGDSVAAGGTATGDVGDAGDPGDAGEPSGSVGSGVRDVELGDEGPPTLIGIGAASGTQPWVGSACESSDDCASASYCGWDRMCHPESHAPMIALEIPVVPIPLVTVPIADPEPEPDPAPTPVDEGPRPGPTGAAALSLVSGTVGDIHSTLDFESGFVSVLGWGESSDRPCAMVVRGWQPDDSADRYARIGDHRNIGSNCSVAATWEVALDNMIDKAISMVAVCDNDRSSTNRRIKGLRIWGHRINDDGTTTFVQAADSHSLTNCREWRAAVMCPTGKLATGIVIHSNEAGGGREQITGLQLVCRSIVAPGVVPN